MDKYERANKILGFLKTCDKDDIYYMFDTGLFNKIVTGYVISSIRSSKLKRESKDNIENIICEELRKELEDMSSKKAESYSDKELPFE